MINLNKTPIQEILNIKICDLDLKLSSSYIYPFINQALQELKHHNLFIKPNFYISDGWFCLDKTADIEIPFYLLHPKLIKIDQKKTGFTEGIGKKCLLFLRHEIGHAIDNVYRLRNKKDNERIKLFGKASLPYKVYYQYHPCRKDFVANIDDYYAQSHPTEDFAETFAIWLNPRSNWKRFSKNKLILKKLYYIDNLMKKLANKKSIIQTKYKTDSILSIKYTIDKYYNQKLSNIKRFNNFKSKHKIKYLDFR